MFLTLLFLLFGVYCGVQGVIPDASGSISYDVEYQAFEEDFLNSIPHLQSELSRAKRFVYLNTDTYVACAFLLGLPLTVVLPSLSNVFNKWRRKRSVLDDQDLRMADDPVVQQQLDRIATYFRLVDIPEHYCQLRGICEFSADPDKYYPLSEMILSRVRNPSLPPMVYMEEEYKDQGQRSNYTATLYEVYSQAANLGLHDGKGGCEKTYKDKCGYSMDKLLNMPTLKFWTAMQRFLKLRFTDGAFSI